MHKGGLIVRKILETDRYIELDIMTEVVNQIQKVGFAEVNLSTGELTRLKIYEPFQNKGIGQEALSQIIKEYGITSVNALTKNDRAIHLYNKLGFEANHCSMVTMYRKDTA